MAPDVTAAIVVTGDELLRGFVADANSSWIGARLRGLGIVPVGVQVTGDGLHAIESALQRAVEAHDPDLVFVSGGLGPTHDDRTTEGVGAVWGRELELRADALANVEAKVWAFVRLRGGGDIDAYADGNRKQATVPAGAVVVEPAGTAPAYVVPPGASGPRAVAVVLPGPPGELRASFDSVLATAPVADVLARVTPAHERLVRVWSVPESRAATALEELGHVDDDGALVTLCARDGELELALRGSDAARVDGLVDGLRSTFGDAVFALDDERGTEELVVDALRARGWTIALAESCTGGMLAAHFTDHAGVSDTFLGGVVSYANDAKRDLLGVDEALLVAHGAVSEEVARAMSEGARERFGADVGVAITGIAGPGGGSDEKPVGTVWLSVATPQGTTARLVRLFGGRSAIRVRASVAALHAIRHSLVAIS